MNLPQSAWQSHRRADRCFGQVVSARLCILLGKACVARAQSRAFCRCGSDLMYGRIGGSVLRKRLPAWSEVGRGGGRDAILPAFRSAHWPRCFAVFCPGVSASALKFMRAAIRDLTSENGPMCQWLTSLGSSIPSCRGIVYYGRFRPAPLGQSFDTSIRQSRLG